jgi:hypothetical protein
MSDQLTTMPDKTRGLYNKFRIERTDGASAEGRKHYGCAYFVLDLDHDPLAMPALAAYAREARKAGYEALAKDLERVVGESDWVEEV